jgi:hypothetical protein
MEDLQTIDLPAGALGALPTAGDSDLNGEGEEEETTVNQGTPGSALEVKLKLADLSVPKIPSGICSPEPEVFRLRVLILQPFVMIMALPRIFVE